MTYVIIIAAFAIFGIIMALVADNKHKINSTKQLTQVLELLGKDNETENILYSSNARWKGILSGHETELEYFYHYKISRDYLYIKIPYTTRTNFFIKNLAQIINKPSYQQSNEICLSYIKNDKVKNRILELLNGTRFCNIRCRHNGNESKFASLPEYDKNKNIINMHSTDETDALSVMLARPQNINERNGEIDFTKDFITGIVHLFYNVRTELAAALICHSIPSERL